MQGQQRSGVVSQQGDTGRVGIASPGTNPQSTFCSNSIPWCANSRGILTRLDVSLYISGGDPNFLRSDILRHVILRWRRNQAMRDVFTTVYWCGPRIGKRPPPRNLTLYGDRHNRATGEVDCVKLELRLLRAYVIRANGIHSISDVIALNPQDLFNRHTKWTDVGDRFVRDVVRKAVNEDRKYYAGKTAKPFTDRYRASIPKRVRDLLRKLGMDRAQTMRDQYPRRQAKTLTMPLKIPTALTFPRVAIARAI